MHVFHERELSSVEGEDRFVIRPGSESRIFCVNFEKWLQLSELRFPRASNRDDAITLVRLW